MAVTDTSVQGGLSEWEQTLSGGPVRSLTSLLLVRPKLGTPETPQGSHLGHAPTPSAWDTLPLHTSSRLQ